MLTQLLWDVILQVSSHEELEALIINGLLGIVFGEDSFTMKLLQHILQLLCGVLAVLLQLGKLSWAQTFPAPVSHTARSQGRGSMSGIVSVHKCH